MVAKKYVIFDKMIEGVQIISPEWRYVYINDTVATHGKYNKDELLGYTMMEKYPGIEHTEVFQHIKNCMEHGTVHQMVNEFDFPDGSKGYFELRIQAIDEGVLVLSFDVTKQKLAEKFLKDTNAILDEKVNQRTKELEEKNRELETFTYSVSHDLRAPLRAINGYIQILKEDYSEKFDEEGNHLTNVILNATKNMDQLIEALLDLSRLGSKELEKTKVSFKEMVTEICENLKTLEQNRAIEYKIKELPIVEADKILLKQVWINLISNAFKYTGYNKLTVIEIGAEKKDGIDTYYIKDNGAGFDMNYYNKLFGVFSRLHSADQFKGTGVGLATVQRIITKHGGKIWATGKPNEGATFYFSLEKKELAH